LNRRGVLISRGLAITLICTLGLGTSLYGVVFSTWEVQVIVTLDPLKELKVVLVFSFDELLYINVLCQA
jgi:hypothetical protein